jgi:hypothetical protein
VEAVEVATRNSEKLKRLVRRLLDAVPKIDEAGSDELIHAICNSLSRRELIEIADNEFRVEVANAIWDEWETWNAPSNWVSDSISMAHRRPSSKEEDN